MGGFTLLRYAVPNADWSCVMLQFSVIPSLGIFVCFLYECCGYRSSVLRSLCWEKPKLKRVAPLGGNKEAMALPMEHVVTVIPAITF